MDRIEVLRAEALRHGHCNDEFYYRFYKKYEKCATTCEYERYAEAFYESFSTLTPHISDRELIVGKTENGMSAAEQTEWESIYRAVAEERCRLAGSGQDSHMAIDYELVLSVGLRGIVERIEAYERTCAPEALPFYRAAKRCLEAVMVHASRYAAHARHLAALCTDGTRKEELLRIAQICDRVPAEPARSFYEAVESVHFITYCVSLNPFRPWHQQFQLGHPDRYLWPYYERDIAAGELTREEAQLLLNCLGIQINLRVPRGLSSGYMVGGRDEEGKTVANELTELLLRVIDDVRLVYPAVGLCYTPDMPDAYLRLACETLCRGRSHPAIFNDDVISEGLRRCGVSAEQSHSYIHSTCVEITPVASSNAWVASPYINMAGLLLDTMTREYESFDSHFEAVLALLDERIAKNFDDYNRERGVRAKNSVNPLLSCFVNDCLARGKDIEAGGARYNWIMPSFVGIANLVDSLYALKQVVYEEGRYTVCGLKKILDRNFEGEEALRLELLHTIPKYGNDDDEVDAYFGRITSHIVEECKRYRAIFSEGRLIPSAFCWVVHEIFGRETGATPDGRTAGFPLGDGSGPCQGRERRGPTASILSSTKWDHRELIGGVAVNMKFSKSNLGPGSVSVLQALVKTYMERGGFELQINVTDRKILEAALRDPQEYEDLVVRIGGYSDYFVRLSAEMQQELLLRTEHQI